MPRLPRLLLMCLLAACVWARDPLAQRIAHTDPAKYRRGRGAHGGAGENQVMTLLDNQSMNTNLIFVHRGLLGPKSGIGHHYHNQMEEMFVIFDNEAQFTIDGRTALVKGPAGAPCRLGRSHAIYNPTDRPAEFMNIAVGSVKAKYDATDLDDNRVDAPLDARPAFITMRLDRKLLRPAEAHNGGQGTAQYRRALRPEVFFTNWAYVDHLVLGPGTSEGRHRHAGVEEVYYVLNGEGRVEVNNESAAIRKGDTVPVFLNEVHSLAAGAGQEMELMILGVAREKNNIDTVAVR